jgi:hypothetical protein
LYAATSFIEGLQKIKAVASTMRKSGDVNPYGVAVVPQNAGALRKNQILVSNFNNAQNFQGTGTTIMQVSPGAGAARVFAKIDASTLPGPCPGGVGLTTALVVLRSGWVIVGSLPTTDGTSATAQAGCLIVLDSSGKVVETISGADTKGDLNGPWDMTALDMGTTADLFVTNVGLAFTAGVTPDSGGTVLRIELSIPAGGIPSVTSSQIIGSGFSERTDPTALVIGPTGVGLGADGTLYVADTLNSRIAAIENAANSGDAGTGTTVSGGGALNQPLGLAIAPNGNILTVNGGDGNMVETTPDGTQVAMKFVDVTGGGAGDLFGLAITSIDGPGVYFVNDGNNTLDWLH